MFIVLLIILALLYFLMNVGLIVIWSRNKTVNTSSVSVRGLSISVIVPVRNEVDNIIQLLEDIERQNYPKNQYEVIVVDDESTDDTPSLLLEYKKRTGMALRTIRLSCQQHNTSPKKRAIDAAIQVASGALIITTDGDCRMNENWLKSIAMFQADTGAFLISAPVTFIDAPSTIFGRLWQQIQTVEFSSLIGSGACAMLVGKPNMCNGANLAYLKSVFIEVGGFAGNENLASGDDEFLMHKIAGRYPDRVRFLKNKDAIVETQAHLSLKSFYNQRKRWASKWKHYDNPLTTALAVFVFLANLAPILTVGLCLLALIELKTALVILMLKFSAELLFLMLVLSFLNKKRLIWLIPLVQIIYPWYIVFFGLVAQGKNKYIWKGRQLQ